MYRTVVTFFVILMVKWGVGQDTLEAPRGSDYLAYKYLNVTPSNLKEAVKALTLYDQNQLDNFSAKELKVALNEGLHPEQRLRADWGFQTGSRLTSYFWRHKIYAPATMKSIILMGLYHALREQPIEEQKIFRKCKRKHRKQERIYKKKYKNGTIYYNTPGSSEKNDRLKPQTYTIDLENTDPEEYPESLFYKN